MRAIIQSVDIKENRFRFEEAHIRIHEVPISYYPRMNREGKKIGFKDGVRALYVIWKYR